MTTKKDIPPENKSKMELHIDLVKFMKILDDLGKGVVYYSAEGTIEAINQSACKVMNLPEKDFLGKSLIIENPDLDLRYFHEDGSEFTREQFPASMAMKTGKVVPNVIMAVAHKNEIKHHWLKVTAEPQFVIGKDRPQGVFVILEDITDRKKLEYNLNERYKEINAFYKLASITEKNLPFEEMYQEIINSLPDSWQYPEITCVRLFIEGKEYTTGNFKKTQWHLSAPVKVFSELAGSLEIYYLEKRPHESEGPFVLEERQLLDAVAERLGRIIERRKTADKLQHNEDLISLALQATGLGKFQQDFARDEVFFDEISSAHFGFDKTIHSSKEVLERIHPEDRERTINESAQYARTGSTDPIIVEYRVIHPDGSIKWIAANSKITYEKINGVLKPIRAVGTTQDITERKNTEKELKQLNDQYNLIANNTDDFFWIYDTIEKKFTYVSPSIEKMHGFTPEEALELSPEQLFTPDSIKKVHELTRQNMSQTGQESTASFTVELTQYRKNGYIFPTETTLKVVTDNTGHLVIIGISRDITRRKEAEYAFLQSQAKLKASLSSMNDAVFITDLDGIPVEYNDAFVSFHRFTNKEECPISPEKWQEVIEFSTLEGKVIPFEKWPANLAVKGNSQKNIEYRLRRLDTGETWIGSYSYSPILDSDGTIMGSVSVSRDITDQILAREALQRKSRALDMLSKCNEALVFEQDEGKLLEKICQICVEKGNYILSWVGFAQQDPQKSVLPVAQFGFNENYLETAKITWDDSPYGRGPAGTAIRKNKIVTINDAASDPTFKPWKEGALKRGYSSIISLPLNLFGNSIGVFTLYSKEANAFKSDEIELLKELANDISFGIESLRTRESQRLLQNELMASQSRFMQAEIAGQIGSWEMDLETGAIYWSDQLFSLFEKDPESFIPSLNNFNQIVSNEDISQMDDALRNAIETHTPFELEFRSTRNTGETKWFITRGNPLFDSTGKVIKITGTTQEITAHKEMEDALSAANRRYQFISDHIQDVLWVMDLESQKFTYVSSSVERLRGFTVEEVLRQPMQESMTSESYELVTSIIKEYLPLFLAGKPLSNKPIRIDQKCKDGSIVPTEVSANYALDINGKVQVIGITRDISERLNAEQQIWQANNNYRLIADNTDDVIWVWDIQANKYTYISPSVQKMHHLSQEEGLTRDVTEVLIPESIKKVNQLVEQNLSLLMQGKTTPSVTLELDQFRKDGSIFPTDTTINFARNEAGTPVLIGITRDITFRKQAELAIYESRAKLKAAFSNMLDAIAIIDNTGNIIEINEAYAALHRYKAIDDCPRLVSEYLTIFEFSFKNGKIVPSNLMPLSRALKGETGNSEFNIRKTTTGETWIANYSYAPIRDDQGQVAGAVIVIRDVTKQRKAEEELRKTTANYRLISENADDVIWVRDVDTLEFTYFSPSIEKLTGFTPEELVGKKLDQFLTPDSTRRVLEMIDRATRDFFLGKEVKTRPLELEEYRKDGSTVPIEITTTLAYDEEGHLLVIGISREITERLKAEEALRLSSETNQAILNATLESVLMMDQDCKVLAINATGAKRIGKPPSEIIGKDFFDLFPRGIAENRTIKLKKVFETGESVNFEDDRGGRHYISNLYPIFDQAGKVKNVVLFAKDNTEEYSIQQALIETEQTRRALFESIPESILLIKTDGTVIMVNSTGSQRLHQTPEKMIGHSMYDFLPDEVREIRKTNIEKAIMTGQPIRFEDIREGRAIVTHAIPILDENNVVIQVAISGFDYTDQKKAEEKLAASEHRSKAIVDAIPDTLFRITRDGTFLDYQAKSVDKLYAPPEVFIGKKISEVLPPDVSQKSMTAIEAAFSQQRIQTFEYSLSINNASATYEARVVANALDQEAVIIVREITDQVEMEEEIRASEEKYRVLMESLDSIVATIDIDGRFLYMNDVAAKQLGGIPHDFIGKTMYELFPPQIAENQLTSIRKAIQENKGFIFENPSIVNGQFRWYRSTIEPIHDDKGNVIAALLNSTDIHDLKLAQEELQKLNDTLEQKVKERSAEVQDLYDNAPTGYHSLGIDGTIQLMNQTELNWLGYKKEELIGKKKYFQLVPDEDYARWKGAFEEFKQKGHIENVEFNLIRKDGSIFPIIINATAIFDKDGKYLQSRSTVFNNSERKAIEAEIRRVHNLSDTALELARAGFWYIPIDGSGIYQSSDRLIDILGTEYRADYRYDLQEYWMKYVELADPGATALASLEINDVISGKKEKYDMIYKFRRPKDDIVIWIHDIGNPVRDRSGKPIGIAGVTQDITEQKKLEDELSRAKEAAETANKAKSNFLANMSHEIRTPMNAILGFTQIILKDKTIDEKNRGYIEIINRSGEHLLTLINEILEMSKIEAGHVTYNPSTFDLPRLVQDLKSMFAPRMEAKQLKMTLDISPQTPRFIISDENKVKEILINLIGNAVKFTEQGGITIHVHTEKDPTTLFSKSLNLYLDIEDTGIGISEEDLPKLFKAFEQTSSGINAFGGTGLGLAISQSHAKMMGGEITVTSILHIGTTFHVKLIVQEGDQPLIENEIQKREVIGLKPGSRKYQIMIADDHEENRLVVQEMLAPLGFSMINAKDGEEAVALTRSEHPDLILMDLRMPGKDGYQASKEIKASIEGKEIPIIALTASILELDKQHLAEFGMIDFLRKPFKENDLFILIEKYLGQIFEYSSETNAEKGKNKNQKLVLTSKIVSTIPIDLIKDLKQAVLSADFDQIMALIDQIEQSSPQIAGRLREMANDFQYDSLIHLLEEGRDHGN